MEKSGISEGLKEKRKEGQMQCLDDQQRKSLQNKIYMLSVPEDINDKKYHDKLKKKKTSRSILQEC